MTVEFQEIVWFLYKMLALLYNRVGLNSTNSVGLTCDLVRKLLMVSTQEQVWSLFICTHLLNDVCHLRRTGV